MVIIGPYSEKLCLHATGKTDTMEHSLLESPFYWKVPLIGTFFSNERDLWIISSLDGMEGLHQWEENWGDF